MSQVEVTDTPDVVEINVGLRGEPGIILTEDGKLPESVIPDYLSEDSVTDPYAFIPPLKTTFENGLV